jgi:2-oxoglutarate dehydrogenase complex dehydrogenase (E1) component-like enzyme
MGAWDFVRPHLEELLADRCPLRFVGRQRASSPSEGSATWHQLNQKALIEQAFDHASIAPEAGLVLSKKV